MESGNKRKTPYSIISMDFLIRVGAVHIWAPSAQNSMKVWQAK